MNKGFRSLADRIVDSLFEAMPFLATASGVHSYDHLLERYDADALGARRGLMRDALKDLKSYENATLTQTEQMDLSVLEGHLSVMLRVDHDLRLHERCAATYVERLFDALYVAVTRDFASPEERAQQLLERLRGLPRYLDTAADNLRAGYDIPATWTETAIEALDGGDLFFRETLQPFLKRTVKEDEDALDVAEGARRKLIKFKTFLRDELLARCDGSFAVGRDLFDYLLDKHHGFSLRAKDLIPLAEGAIADTKAQLVKLAAEIAPGKTWEKLVSEARRQHPAPEKLVAAYRKEMERARDFLVKRDLVTLPEGEKLTVTETPPFARPVLPYAAYLPPAPLEQRQEGLFWVTPVDKAASAERRQQMLEEHPVFEIPVTAVHEAYPGHHVQTLHANRSSSKVRRVFTTQSFDEGWALYGEELMQEEGFYEPRTRLFQLRMLLLRVYRVLIDVKLHLRQLTMDEAVDMLVEEIGVERRSAIAEVKRYALTPTQPMSYLVGRRAILALRDEYRQQKGDKWKLKEFHDRLLSFGSIPLSLVREALLK